MRAVPSSPEHDTVAPASLEPTVSSERTPVRRKRARGVALVLVTLAAGGAAASYVVSRGRETTDDAQVEGHVELVSPRVQGVIARALVVDNQHVKAGDVLFELDRADFEGRLAVAKADVLSSEAALGAAQAQFEITEKTGDATLRQANGGLKQASSVVASSQALLSQSRAEFTSAQARQKLAAAEFERADKLMQSGAMPAAQYDAARATLDQANAGLSQSEARLASAQASIAASFGGVESAEGRLVAARALPAQLESARAAVQLAEARLEQSRAALHLAELALSYTTIRAPSDGMVARRSAELGQTVAPERPLLAIVPLEDVWIVANFKEDQLAHLRAGAAARVRVDAFGDREFKGHVESLSAGTGSRFALLPPDNASGNFVKVVQRVPVLVRLDVKNRDELRPGMSAKVTVDTR